MTLQNSIAMARANAERLRGLNSVNEANTKALVIEPILAALGWDLLDIDAFEREVRVYDGTLLDYALKVSGERRMYVEAKALGVNLADPKFVAQAVNYANNDGVVWCALTNGLRWRIFKTNESVAMDQKVLFELDLDDLGEVSPSALSLLELIGSDALASGELDRYGERMFTDGRMRSALRSLAAEPSTELIRDIKRAIGRPALSEDALRRSLARVLDSKAPEVQAAPPVGLGVASPSMKATEFLAGQAPRGQEYPLAHHLDGKGALITELFNEVDDVGRSLGGDVERRVRKHYVGYYRGKKSFFTAELQKQRLWIYLSIDPSLAQPWVDGLMRDVTGIGHYGMGNTEFSLSRVEDLLVLKQLLRAAYDAASA